MTSKDRISGRYSRAAHDQTTIGSLLPGFELNIPPRNIVALASWTHIFTSQLVAEFRGSFTRSEFVQCSANCYKQGYYSQFGINHPLAGAQFEGAPTLTFSNISLTTFGDDDFNYSATSRTSLTMPATSPGSAATIPSRTGFKMTRYQQNTPGPVTGLRRGTFNFRGDFTVNAFADFLWIPYTASRVVGKGSRDGPLLVARLLYPGRLAGLPKADPECRPALRIRQPPGG